MRESGVLFHITSLPCKYGIGTIGKCAYDFVDFLVESEQSYWQVLPICPTGYGDSPYQSSYSYAGNPYFIDLEELIALGLLDKEAVDRFDFGSDSGRVDYEKLFYNRFTVLRMAYDNLGKCNDALFVERFCEFKQSGKFMDYGVFMSLKDKYNHLPWQEWDEQHKYYSKELLCDYYSSNADDVDFWRFLQFCYFDMWARLRAYANERGVKIIGDMPIYVASDSVDVWSQKENFVLGDDLYPELVAGVPPDAFSVTGQLWGNPIYNWEAMQNNNFAWWQDRLESAMQIYDRVRIDHFRGFSRYYTIKRGCSDATIGEWVDCPGERMFEVMEENIPNLDIIAENLGTIDEQARALFNKTGYPGMKVLVFSFNADKSCDHRLCYHTENDIVYTGTHDNETMAEYIKDNISKEMIGYIKEQLEDASDVSITSVSQKDLVATACEMAFSSRANVCIIPLQDLLGIQKEGRMNVPSLLSLANWSFRLKTPRYKKIVDKLKSYNKRFDRNQQKCN